MALPIIALCKHQTFKEIGLILWLFPFQNLLEFFSKRCNGKWFLDESFGACVKYLLGRAVYAIATAHDHLQSWSCFSPNYLTSP